MNHGEGQGQYSGSQWSWGTYWSDENPDHYCLSLESDEEPIYYEPGDPDQTLVKHVADHDPLEFTSLVPV